MSDIGIMSGLWIFAFFGLVAVVGVVLAVVESFVFGVHWLWALLLLVAGTGWLITEIEPFTFADRDSTTLGIVTAGGALLLLTGYVLGTFSAVAFGRLKRKNAQ